MSRPPGLTAAHHRVLQIAVSQLRPDGGLEATWSTLLDPGCDPGPVHIHGLTPRKRRGSPTFADIAHTLVDLLRARIQVAHNARFDWDFLAAEADRARTSLGVTSRLCTIALSRRLGLAVVTCGKVRQAADRRQWSNTEPAISGA
ncbi:MAG: exonuclease domain-containing protein [bacterium]